MKKLFNRNRKLKENKRAKSVFEKDTGSIIVKAVNNKECSGLINRFIKETDIENNLDIVTTLVPHTVLIDIPKYYYNELIELFEYIKTLDIITLENDNNHMVLVLSGTVNDFRYIVNNVPSQNINKLYSMIKSSLFILPDDMMTDLIKLRIFEDHFIMPDVYKIPDMANNMCVLYDTYNSDAIKEIRETYKISDMKKVLNMSYMSMGINDGENSLSIINILHIMKSGLNHIIVEEPKTKNNITMIISGTYLQWIKLISTDFNKYKDIVEYLADKTGLSSDQLLSMIIEPRSVHQNIIYNSSFDPNIDEIIEDIIEEDVGGNE